MLIAIGVSLMFGMARRKLTDYKRMKRVNKEVKEFNKALMAAKKRKTNEIFTTKNDE